MIKDKRITLYAEQKHKDKLQNVANLTKTSVNEIIVSLIDFVDIGTMIKITNSERMIKAFEMEVFDVKAN